MSVSQFIPSPPTKTLQMLRQCSLYEFLHPRAAASALAFMENKVKWNGMTFVTSPKWVFCGQVFLETHAHHSLSYDYTLERFLSLFWYYWSMHHKIYPIGLYLFICFPTVLGAPRSCSHILYIPESPVTMTLPDMGYGISMILP